MRTRLALTPLLLFSFASSGCEDRPPLVGPPASAPIDAPGNILTLPAYGNYLVAPDEHDFVTRLAEGVSPEDFANQHGLTLLESYGQYALFTGPIELEDLAELQGVEDASSNQEVHLSESLDLTFGFFEGEWEEGEVFGQDAFEILDLPAAHRISTGTGLKIAALDTGADLDHVHLRPAIESLGPDEELISEETLNGIDEDEDGMVDEAFGHGTHVAGILRTVAPGATILPIKVLTDDGIGSLWDFLKGLELARDHQARIINLSMSLSPPSQLVEDMLAELQAEGIVIVSAAGNDGWRHPAYPAVSPLTLGVAALESNGSLSTFTGAGSEIALAAPGVAVLSSYPGNQQIYGTGTSMATPIVSGTLALALQANPQDVAQAIAATCLTAVPLEPMIAAIWGRVVPPLAAMGGSELDGSRLTRK